MKRPWSEEVVENFPNCFEPWNQLPNELKAFVCQKMDAQTGADFKNCGGRVEAKLARKYVRNEVNVQVKYIKAEKNEPESMMIELRDARTNSFQLSWCISAQSVRTTKVVFTSAKPQTLVLTRKYAEDTFSMILQRLLTEPMFIVKNLEFHLGYYTKKIKQDSIKGNVECLIFNGCFYQWPVDSILEQKTLEYKAAVGASSHDLNRILQFERHSQTVFNRYYYNCIEISRLLYSLQQNPPVTFAEAQEKMKEFCELTLGTYHFEDRTKRDDKIELPKTTNDIMYFRAAYHYQSNSMPYLQNTDDRFEEKIASLKDGIDGHLSDYELIILSISYFVRLYRYEPAMRDIEEQTLKSLEFMSIKHGALDNRFVSKIETLLP